MDRKTIITIITALTGISAFYYFLHKGRGAESHDLMEGAVVLSAEVFFMAIIGIIVSSGKQNKDIGQGILLGTGITLLIGFGICSFT